MRRRSDFARVAILGLLGLGVAACGSRSQTSRTTSQHANTLPISFDLMHTRPECNHPPHPSTWCAPADQAALAALSGMESRANALIDLATDPAHATITIAYFSFSDQAVFAKLCDKGKAGFSVEGFFDQSYRTALPAQLAQCQGPSGNNVRVHFLGQLSQSPWIWRLHHNKFLVVDPGDGSPVSINFSSGNLSAYGMSEHFDHWALLRAPAASSLYAAHRCVIGALRAAIDPTGAPQDQQIDDPGVYRSTLEQCFQTSNVTWNPNDNSWVEQAVATEGIAPLFSPDPAGRNAQILIDHINRVQPGGHIYGAMQNFNYADVALAMQAAVQRGVDVRLVMDAAVLTGQSEVPGALDFYNQYLKQSISGVDVQFMVVDSADFQMMHNKFLVMENLDGSVTRVFSGAGHFTDAGLRDNYENFYVSQSDDLTGRYQELFNYMWPRSATESQVLGSGGPPNPNPSPNPGGSGDDGGATGDDGGSSGDDASGE